jgi:hypothetical protein
MAARSCCLCLRSLRVHAGPEENRYGLDSLTDQNESVHKEESETVYPTANCDRLDNLHFISLGDSIVNDSEEQKQQ